MNSEQWLRVDDYICDKLIPADPVLDQALQASARAGLPAINVSPAQGKFLHLLARIRQAQRILEIGTLGGYSTIWLARALPPGGRLITLELDPKHAAVAEENIARAGLSNVVELRIGSAVETLPQLLAENRGPFDLVFIDADKPSNAEYFRWALRVTKVGSVIIVDNVVRKGAVVEAHSTDANVRGVREFMDLAAQEPRVSGTVIQTVGSKGYDGLAMLVVVDSAPIDPLPMP
jgi:predicted O-methyltransferase YrrM